MLLFLFVVCVIVSLCIAGRPNVVVIVADDWGWNDFGLHGSDQVQTYNLDALAYSGIILHNYYTMCWCSPSRSALMTGIHPAHTGMQTHVLGPGEPYGLPLNVKILPQYLKDDGYTNYAIGKWHLGDYMRRFLPTERGFDYHFGYWEGNQDHYEHTMRTNEDIGYDFHRNLDTFWEAKGKYGTDLYTEEAIKMIELHDQSHPMFLYVAHQVPHGPVEAPEEAVERFPYIVDPKRRTFAAMVWKLDESVGKIVAALGAKNMLSNTVIVVTTDNGGAVNGVDNSTGSNWPLRGGKTNFYEGGVRGNALIWSPYLPSSRISRHLMHIQDWVPTILGAVNSSHLWSEDVDFDGANMWPVLMGEVKNSYDEVLLQSDPLNYRFAYRQGDYKLMQGIWYANEWYSSGGRKGCPPYNLSAVESSYVARTFKELNLPFPSTDRMRKVRANTKVDCSKTVCNNRTPCKPCDENSTLCLFDLKSDPCERNNLAADLPHIVEKLMERVAAFNPAGPLNRFYDFRSRPKNWGGVFTPWCDFVDCGTRAPPKKAFVLHRKYADNLCGQFSTFRVNGYFFAFIISLCLISLFMYRRERKICLLFNGRPRRRSPMADEGFARSLLSNGEKNTWFRFNVDLFSGKGSYCNFIKMTLRARAGENVRDEKGQKT